MRLPLQPHKRLLLVQTRGQKQWKIKKFISKFYSMNGGKVMIVPAGHLEESDISLNFFDVAIVIDIDDIILVVDVVANVSVVVCTFYKVSKLSTLLSQFFHICSGLVCVHMSLSVSFAEFQSKGSHNNKHNHNYTQRKNISEKNRYFIH